MLFTAIKFSSDQDPGPWSQDTLALPRCRVARNETLDALWAAKTQTAERRMANCTPLCCRKSGNRQNHLLRRFASITEWYSSAYARAERVQEKSFCMPLA